MSPDEAEAEAAKLGLEPLAAAPDPLVHKPMGEVWWTLPMTVAWIAWRGAREVLENYDPYRLECWDWHYRKWRIGPDGPIHEGWSLDQRSRATLPRLVLEDIYGIATQTIAENSIPVREAQAQLWKALQDGQLQATGIANDEFHRKPIPDYEWCDLKAVEEGGRDVLRYDTIFKTGYREVNFRRKAVMALWPESRLPQSGPETDEQHSTSGIRTGAAGRPTPMHLVVAEHRNRLADGRAEVSVVAESECLARWLKETHSSLPPLTAKTIRNKISLNIAAG